MTSEISKDGKAARPFINDIEPYFYGRPVTYVDAGAHNGSVFRQLLTSGFYIREAHLVEPNPRTFEALRTAVSEVRKVNHVACHNLALSSTAGSVLMRDEDSMTHVVADPEHQPADPAMFEVETTTLDDLVQQSQIGHINLLKIDVEGHELQVLEGARKTLAAEGIDIIYIETGLDPDSEQHVHYRAVEEALAPDGYRIIRFYEQRNEWLEDSPLLRRTNIAFVSRSFAERHPYKLSRELVRLRKTNEELTRTNDELRAANEGLTKTNDELRARAAETDAKVAKLQNEITAVVPIERERDAAVAEANVTAKRLDEAREKAAETNRRLVRERDRFVAYADEVEKRYVGVLHSRTWRVMAPARVFGRAVRRLRGRSADRNKLPKRPSIGSDGSAAKRGGRHRG